MDSATREIVELHVLQNKQDLLNKNKSVISMAEELGVRPHSIYDGIARLRRRGLYPAATVTRNRKKKYVNLPSIDLAPLATHGTDEPDFLPPDLTKRISRSTMSHRDNELMEMKATIMAQEKIIKYLEKQLEMRHGSSV